MLLNSNNKPKTIPPTTKKEEHESPATIPLPDIFNIAL